MTDESNIQLFMINDEHINNLNKTGKWLIDRTKELVIERKKTKRVSKKLENRWKELHARINLYLKDMKKVTNEGEKWKNEN